MPAWVCDEGTSGIIQHVPMPVASLTAERCAACRLPDLLRELTPRLRGVLAETALNGTIRCGLPDCNPSSLLPVHPLLAAANRLYSPPMRRYSWRLLQPLLLFALEHAVTQFEAANEAEVGPPRPLPR